MALGAGNKLQTAFPVNNRYFPTDGKAKVLSKVLDFTSVTSIQFDLKLENELGRIETIQGVFVDNSANASSVTLLFGVTQQKLVIPADAQGTFPVFTNSDVGCTATSAGGVVVPIFFFNTPLPFSVWGAASGGGGGGGLVDIAYTETDGAATGASVAVLGANAARKDLMIVAHSANVGSLNVAFGQAASAASWEITPGGVWVPRSGYITTQSVNIIGANVGDLYSVLEGA